MPRTDVTATRTQGTPSEAMDLCFMLGGLSLIAGILARNRYLSYGGLAIVVSAAVPDMVRYVKISSM